MRSGSFAMLFRKSMWPMTLRNWVEMTVMVSCPLLATNTRLPSGEQTMFQGSAPVRISPPGPTDMST